MEARSDFGKRSWRTLTGRNQATLWDTKAVGGTLSMELTYPDKAYVRCTRLFFFIHLIDIEVDSMRTEAQWEGHSSEISTG